MKSFLIIALFPILLFSCDLLDPRPKDTRIAHGVLRKTTNEIKQRFNLDRYSFTESGSSGEYKLLGLGFIKNGKINQSKARKLMIECTEIFLEKINSEEKFQQYLFQHPFTEKNINLSILVRDDNGERFYRPHVTSINLINGSIHFNYNIPGEEYKLEHEIETYEEALRIVEDENQKNPEN